MANHRFIPFWPQDFTDDEALNECSLEARGLWVYMLCMAHKGEPYGHLTVNERPATVGQIAKKSGIPPKKCEKLLSELETHRVFSRTDDGVIYSRRMVRDHRKSQQGQEAAAKRWHGEPNGPPNGSGNSSPNGPPNAQIKSVQIKSNQIKPSARDGAAQEEIKNFGFKGERMDRSGDHDQPASDDPRLAQVVAFTTKALTTRLPYGEVRTKNEQLETLEPPRRVKASYLTPEQLKIARAGGKA